MIKERFKQIKIGATFVYGGHEYVKQTMTEAQATDGSHVISFTADDVNQMMVESSGSELLRG